CSDHILKTVYCAAWPTTSFLYPSLQEQGTHYYTCPGEYAGHRLLTHVLCAPDKLLLLLSLLLFLVLYWRLEKHLGTVYFLYFSCLCTLCCATLYLFISLLLPVSVTPASGYLATQISLLMGQRTAIPWRLGKRLMPLLLCGILIATQVLWPQSPLLLHICGVISGFAGRAGLLRYLDLPDTRRHALDRMYFCHCLTSFPLAQFIPTLEEGTRVYDMDSRAQERLPFSYTDLYKSTPFTDMSMVEVNTQNSDPAHLRDTSAWFGDPGMLEHEMLEAGILASLRDYEQEETHKHELTLNKSSVSALRLQQLERMGFPTGPAVVALAATGKVERAVSLLVEGEIGRDITVASNRQTSHGHLSSSDYGHINL
ncbi:rhomboid domain-containing protein 3-like, partial [Pseudophryne corroboree]|uniref:rhomboid domain-containing protein 3-like n=1 Tax=Pseudophryne corroboree TaxID=495146 RepID=UPI003081A5D4